jgi:hypothetical protein
VIQLFLGFLVLGLAADCRDPGGVSGTALGRGLPLGASRIRSISLSWYKPVVPIYLKGLTFLLLKRILIASDVVFSILAISEIGIPISFIYKSITANTSLKQVNSIKSYNNRTTEHMNGQNDTPELSKRYSNIFLLKMYQNDTAKWSKRYVLRNFTLLKKKLKNFDPNLDNPIGRGYILYMFNRSVD